MSQRDKRLEKATNNPKDLSFDELCQIYVDWGFTVEGGKGSHFVAKPPHGTPVRSRTFPRGNPMKRWYVEAALEAIEELQQYGLER